MKGVSNHMTTKFLLSKIKVPAFVHEQVSESNTTVQESVYWLLLDLICLMHHFKEETCR